jgi:hypothetical protein
MTMNRRVRTHTWFLQCNGRTVREQAAFDVVELNDGDVMEVHFDGFGRPLRNPVQVAREKGVLVEVPLL